jgi:hypothetical protein
MVSLLQSPFPYGEANGTDIHFYRSGGARKVPLWMVFLILEYYCDLSFLLFPHRKGNILSIIPNSKVVLLSFIVLAKKSPKKLAPQFLVPKIYVGMTPKIKPKVLFSSPQCWNYKLSIRQVKMATAMRPLFEPTKRWNFNSVLKTQQSLHSQKLRTIVVQKYHLRW